MLVASTNRNIAREDAVPKASPGRRLLAGEPRQPWLVTKVEFPQLPMVFALQAPWETLYTEGAVLGGD